jgi:MinD-like ATPase involved in chromosome partitioning or flagellar assembly
VVVAGEAEVGSGPTWSLAEGEGEARPADGGRDLPDATDVVPVEAVRGWTEARPPQAIVPPTAPEGLDFGALVRLAPPAGAGWRRAVRVASLGLLRLGPGAEERRRRELVGLARTPVQGRAALVAVVSAKGGVGKTTVTGLLASELGRLRHDRVLAVDANSQRGNLAARMVVGESHLTTREVARDAERLMCHADLRKYTSQDPEARLEVLAAPLDPAAPEGLSEDECARLLEVLCRYYNVLVADVGTALLDGATRLLLSRCELAVVVAGPSSDGAQMAAHTLDWLAVRRGGDFVREATAVVVNGVRRRGPRDLDLDRMGAWFRRRAGACLEIAWDRHLAAGGPLDWARIAPAVRDGYLELAAWVGAGFRIFQTAEAGGGHA